VVNAADESRFVSRIGSLLSRLERRLPDRIGGLVGRIADREILLTASSLAFYGLVSALPLLMLSFAAVEAIAGEQTLQAFTDQAAETGPEGTGAFLEPLLASGGSLTLATVLFTLWPATAYGGGLRRALMRWSSREEVASGLRGRIGGLGLVLVLPALIMAGLPLMFTIGTVTGGGSATALGWALALLIGAGFGTGVTTLLYKAFSPAELRLRDAAAGAALTAVTTAVFSLLFVIYLSVGDTEERFGGGATAVVVLIGLWLFVANILLLAGYQAVLAFDRGDGIDEPA
jgi:membrane protein